jgi:tetratricopeptide (TPR) repeat protein
MAHHNPSHNLVQLPEGYQSLEYEIVDEPLEDAYSRVPEALGDEAAELHQKLYGDPRSIVARLEELNRIYPDSAVLANWLTVAYQLNDRDDEANALIVAQFQKWPDYLFARINYARMLLLHGDLDRVLDLFQGIFSLKLLYPHRSRFHLSEFVAFSTIAGEYFHARGDHEQALTYLELLLEIAPDHTCTQHLENLLMPAAFAHAMSLMKELALPKRRKQKKDRKRR